MNENHSIGLSKIEGVLQNVNPTFHALFNIRYRVLWGYAHTEVNGEDGAEDVRHGSVAERVDGDDVKMAQKPRWNLLPTSSSRSHGSPNLDVLYF